MGSEKSFQTFPDDLIANLNGFDMYQYEYETRGDFTKSMIQLAEYLGNLKNEEVYILAHSMGGPLSVDAALKLHKPIVKGIISFDSPFFGLNPSLVQAGYNRSKEAIDNVSQLVNSAAEYLPARKSSGWGLLAVGALAIAGFTASQPKVQEALTTVTSRLADSFDFLGPLWDVPNQTSRFEFLEKIKPSFQFHGVYLQVFLLDIASR
jgi:pimeloyl-ACP methyl ester carboxylesterase